VEKAIGREKVLIRTSSSVPPGGDLHPEHKAGVKLYQVRSKISTRSAASTSARASSTSLTTRAEAKHGKFGFFKGSLGAITGLTKALGLKGSPILLRFMQMMFLDPTGFDSQHYVFNYVRKEFLGSVRTWVFDVHQGVRHGPVLWPHLDRG